MSISTGDSVAPRQAPASSRGGAGVCRACGAALEHVFADLGMQPLANTYPSAAELERPEPFYPLRVLVCDRCFLVQLGEYVSPEHIFSDYAYFSSYSDSWLEHARTFAEMAVARFGLDGYSRVVEVGSNDGYLLQYFVRRGIPVLGVDPAANVAPAAAARGVRTAVKFFGETTARALASDDQCADLLIGNNVLAHVPELNDFVGGLRLLLKPRGVITMEFPHLLRLIEEHEFDTIYHEHFSYFSFTAAQQVFEAHGLRLFDVEELPTHGGSLRIYACHAGDDSHRSGPRVGDLALREQAFGLGRMETYLAFGERVKQTKRKLLEFLIGVKEQGKIVVGYGAPAKGNTLLNYCGIRTDFIECTFDRNPHKQGRYLPGTRIPIHHPDRLAAMRPDYVLILPWNLRDEIVGQLACIREWGGRFVTPIPEARVVS
jgi:SAM-dependent methyltransferase